jgi:putative transposase
MGLYKKEKQDMRRCMEAELIIEMVKKIKDEQPRIGVRKLQVLLQQLLSRKGIKIGRDGLFDLLREFDMLVKRKRYKHYSTDSRHIYHKHPNQIKGLVINRPNQLWVSDITYLQVANGFYYLFLITDSCSRKIVGFCLSKSYSVKGALEALKMALRQNKISSGLVHHSDRGIQYCCQQYTALLKKKNFVISMTENSDPYENAVAERVNGILKGELLQLKYNNELEAMKSVMRAVKIYNTKRPHMSIGLLTPDQAHQQENPVNKLWKPKQYIKSRVNVSV